MATMVTIHEGDESVEDFKPFDHLHVRLSSIQDADVDLDTKKERARALAHRYVTHRLLIALREAESELKVHHKWFWKISPASRSTPSGMDLSETPATV